MTLPRIYVDHNVAREAARLLRAHGHDVVTAGELGTARDTDGAHLLAATQQGRALVTHDTADFLLLHDAWLRWFDAYAVQPAPLHAGILVIPQPDHRRRFWLPDHAAREIHTFLAQGLPLGNRLYLWTVSRGWVPRQG